MTVEPIRMVFDYLDEDRIPVSSRDEAYFTIITEFDDKGNIESQTTEINADNANKESFDPVYNTWPVGEQNPDYAASNQTGYDPQIYDGNNSTRINQATPNFAEHRIELDTGTGKMDPRTTDRNIVPRADQAFMDINPSFDFEESPNEWQESFDLQNFASPSSFVGSVTYNPASKLLDVVLNGKPYDYPDIPEHIYQGFKAAPSKGKFFNQVLQKRFGLNRETLTKAIEFKEAFVKETEVDFDWIDEDTIRTMIMEGAKSEGKYILIRAAQPQITDHRPEGEQYKRAVTADVLKRLTYTAIRKDADINHIYPKRQKDSGVVVDAEFNDGNLATELIFFETDDEILNGIRDGFITAVSINGGQARSHQIIDKQGKEVKNPDIHCITGECFRKGRGIVLGERDNIAFTWVVTKPGFAYNGKPIPPTQPGIKTTRIYILE